MFQLDPTRNIEYTYGGKDVFTVIFYVMVCIIIHQVIQEYLIDVSGVLESYVKDRL